MLAYIETHYPSWRAHMNETVVVLIVLGVILSIAACVAVAVTAQKCGRNSGSWFVVSLFFTPVLALLMLIAVGPGDAAGSVRERVSLQERRQARLSGA